MRYEYQVEGNEVTCTTHFAGLPVVGVAKCDPLDEFDENYGKRLAKARADAKVAEKRQQTARRQLTQALDDLERAKRLIAKKQAYFDGATVERIMCDCEVDQIIEPDTLKWINKKSD